jgi:hypothetical protein
MLRIAKVIVRGTTRGFFLLSAAVFAALLFSASRRRALFRRSAAPNLGRRVYPYPLPKAALLCDEGKAETPEAARVIHCDRSAFAWPWRTTSSPAQDSGEHLDLSRRNTPRCALLHHAPYVQPSYTI